MKNFDINDFVKADNKIEYVKEVYDSMNRMHWCHLSAFPEYETNSEFIREFANDLVFNDLVRFKQIDEDIIIEFKDRIRKDIFEEIGRTQNNLSQEFVIKFINELNLAPILENPTHKITCEWVDSIMDIIPDSVLNGMVYFRELEDWFILKHIKRIGWFAVASYQPLSYEFVIAYMKKLKSSRLIYNEKWMAKAPLEFIKEFSHKINWRLMKKALNKNPNVSKDFIKKATKHSK